MPYIGSSPATTALTADDIADGAITTAKINDDAVTLAKFASGTDGNIITYDASGNPAAVSTGSSGQILTSAGSGSPPTFASAAAGGKILQVVNTSTGALATGTTAHVLDDTIPQNSEGNEVMTLAITPASSSNYLIIEAQINGAVNSDVRVMAALYQDSTANALACNYNMLRATNYGTFVYISHYMQAGTTSSTTFKIRAGGSDSGTFTFNGAFGGRYFAGVQNSFITITEISA